MNSVLLAWIELFIEGGYKFSHFYEMDFTTVNNKKYMTFEKYNKQPMQLVKLMLNTINYETPQLINILDRRIKHPLIRTYKYVSNS